MAKAKAISTQLKEAQAQIEKLEKELKAAQDAKNMYYNKNQETEKEIEQVHALLDVLPGDVGRKTDNEDSWQRKDINMMTRLASYLANRVSS